MSGAPGRSVASGFAGPVVAVGAFPRDRPRRAGHPPPPPAARGPPGAAGEHAVPPPGAHHPDNGSRDNPGTAAAAPRPYS
ncbi:hypothetical protein ACFV0W_11100, partial [Streptomyces anulatus]